MLGTFAGGFPYFNDAVAATKQAVFARKGQLYWMKLVNTTGATAYLQMFNALAANVTVGTTTPDQTIRLAASESVVIPLPIPWVVDNGIVIAGTTTATGSSGAAISVSAFYE